MLTKINPFSVGAVIGQTKLNAEKTALRGRRNIHIQHAIAQLKILQNRGTSIEQ